jgi:GNAT superfamily N-acetyltransferase
MRGRAPLPLRSRSRAAARLWAAGHAPAMGSWARSSGGHPRWPQIVLHDREESTPLRAPIPPVATLAGHAPVGPWSGSGIGGSGLTPRDHVKNRPGSRGMGELGMTVQLVVRTATRDDLPTVHKILDEAATWLSQRGIHQWPTPYPREPISRACTDRLLWVGSRSGRIVATMRTALHDPDIWGDYPLSALYVQALAVRREPTSRGSGLELLRWAARTAAHNNLLAVRLDCWAENWRLRRYYQQAGFRHVGDVGQSDGSRDWQCSLFEMIVGRSITSSAR